MIYPETLEAKLGFDLIRAKLKNYCLSPAGQEWVDIMKFSRDWDFMNILLRQNLEFRLILEKGRVVSSGISSILPHGFKKFLLKVIGWMRKSF